MVQWNRNEDMNKIVWEWFVSVRARNLRTSGPEDMHGWQKSACYVINFLSKTEEDAVINRKCVQCLEDHWYVPDGENIPQEDTEGVLEVDK